MSKNDTFISQTSSDVNESTIKRWVPFEIDSIIQNATLSDAHDDVNLIMEKGTAESTMTSDSLNVVDADEEAHLPVVLPSISEIGDLFSNFENISYDCNVSDPFYFLRKTQTALPTARKKSEPEYGRQLLISEILKYFIFFSNAFFQSFIINKAHLSSMSSRCHFYLLQNIMQNMQNSTNLHLLASVTFEHIIALMPI